MKLAKSIKTAQNVMPSEHPGLETFVRDLLLKNLMGAQKEQNTVIGVALLKK